MTCTKCGSTAFKPLTDSGSVFILGKVCRHCGKEVLDEVEVKPIPDKQMARKYEPTSYEKEQRERFEKFIKRHFKKINLNLQYGKSLSHEQSRLKRLYPETPSYTTFCRYYLAELSRRGGEKDATAKTKNTTGCKVSQVS